MELIVEDGTGLATANSYVSVAACDTFHEGHLYATAWTGASGPNKIAALAMATRVIDATVKFRGFKKTTAQLLQWPRYGCPDPDAQQSVGGYMAVLEGRYLSENAVPLRVQMATCELARLLLSEDRTADVQGAGLRGLEIAEAIKLQFDVQTARTMLSELAMQMLAPIGDIIGNRSGTMRLVRS